MEIPYKELSDEALRALIEEFVLREGTEYGAQDYSLESKVRQVRRQLHAGEAKISYDSETQTCQIFLVTNNSQLASE